MPKVTPTNKMPKDKPTRKAAAPKERQKRAKKGKSTSTRLTCQNADSFSDPNAPKRGLSAYMFFANDNRETVREENPGISFGKNRSLNYFVICPLTPPLGQVGKALGEKWKALSDSERKPYDDKAAADKKRYEDEKAKYQAVSVSIP